MVIENVEEFIRKFEELGKCPMRRTDGNPCYAEAKETSVDEVKVCNRHKKHIVRINWRSK